MLFFVVLFGSGFATGIYTTNNAEACHYVAENAKCNIIVVENDQQLQKFLQVRSRLPHLKAIVQYSGKPKADLPNVYSVRHAFYSFVFMPIYIVHLSCPVYACTCPYDVQHCTLFCYIPLKTEDRTL